VKAVKRIYLDHAATTPLDKRVLEEMLPFFSKRFGNASSLHSFGKEAREAIEKAREKIARAINAKPEEIIFNSGGTEGDNTALKGTALLNRKKGNHIITTGIEHHAVLHAAQWLESAGFSVTTLKTDGEGFIDLGQLERAIGDKTILVSVMHANNEIGTILPIREIGRICMEKGVVFHTDAVQSLGKEKVDVKKMNVGLLSASAHKFYGPKGVGFLYKEEGTKLMPLVHGGGHERGLRSGTENTPGIVGMGKALELAEKEREDEAARERKLAKTLVGELLEIKHSSLNGPPVGRKRLSNNVNMRFGFVEGESMVLMLDSRGIACSTGSACSTKELAPSHVLTAIGLTRVEAHGSMRFTLGKSNTGEDIAFVAEQMRIIVKKLREISPMREAR
jgi:cysteine desulfurase